MCRNLFLRSVLFAAAGVAMAAPLAAADKGPLGKASEAAQARKVEPVLVRLYNVQDLTLGRDYPYRSRVVPPTSVDPYAEGVEFERPGREAAFGELFGTEVEAAPTQAGALTPPVLVELIKKTVDPESWEEFGHIDRVGALLVVTQTAENHKKIAELLDQLRGERQMVSIEAKWVLLDDAQVAKIVPEDAAKRTVPQEVTPAALREAGAAVIYRGHITCFDRQTVHVASGRGQTVQADIEPVVAEAAVAWDPVLSTLLWGALLEVTPVLAPDGRTATLRLHSLVTESARLRTVTVEAQVEKSPAVKNTVELPEFLLHTFRTAVRAPIGKDVLVGGITAPNAADGKVLYLILHISASK